MKLSTFLFMGVCCVCLSSASAAEPKLSFEKALGIAKETACNKFPDLKDFYLASGALQGGAETKDAVWKFRWVAKGAEAHKELVVKVNATLGKPTATTVPTLPSELHKVIIPEVHLDDVPLADAVAELRRLLREAWPEGRKVNFILQVGPEDPGRQSTVTMEMRNIPFDQLLRYFAMGANLSC